LTIFSEAKKYGSKGSVLVVLKIVTLYKNEVHGILLWRRIRNVEMPLKVAR
jgi:hypothetical protein